jgi:hypothetical protein
VKTSNRNELRRHPPDGRKYKFSHIATMTSSRWLAISTKRMSSRNTWGVPETRRLCDDRRHPLADRDVSTESAPRYLESTGHHCWLTVDARHVPGLPPSVTGYISVCTDDEMCEGGRVEVSPSGPKRAGTELYAHTASVLPPVDAVFSRGSEVVGAWIRYRFPDDSART